MGTVHHDDCADYRRGIRAALGYYRVGVLAFVVDHGLLGVSIVAQIELWRLVPSQHLPHKTPFGQGQW